MAAQEPLFDQLADALDYGLGRGISFFDQGFELITAFRFEHEFALPGFRDEFGVLHGRRESVAQQLEPIRRQIGRRDEWTPDALASVEELDRLLVGVIVREFHDERHALQFRIGLRAALEQDGDGLGRYRVRPAHLDAVDALADALHLAAFYRQEYVSGRGIPADNPEHHAKNII